ncbi:hypothetical protein EVG18_04190 [Burkholderia pyrrocinia]|nr:hypothetical protein EVG18_04190 [Burkholderia pyrrocinia]
MSDNERGRLASRIGRSNKKATRRSTCRFFSSLCENQKKWLGLLQRLLECVCTKGSRSRVQAVTLANAQHLSGRWSPQYSVVTSSGSVCRAVWHATDRSLRYARC